MSMVVEVEAMKICHWIDEWDDGGTEESRKT